jgi:hypothetical protein
MAMVDVLAALVADADVTVRATTATEYSGFQMTHDLSDTLIVAISQSGTTTDTNRTVDLARGRGASVVAIVNRRRSDLTDKADGVLYTSDGRDVESRRGCRKYEICGHYRKQPRAHSNQGRLTTRSTRHKILALEAPSPGRNPKIRSLKSMRRISFSLVIAVFLMMVTVSAMAQMPMPKPAPELSRLDYLAGKWVTEGDMKPGPMGPGAIFNFRFCWPSKFTSQRALDSCR